MSVYEKTKEELEGHGCGRTVVTSVIDGANSYTLETKLDARGNPKEVIKRRNLLSYLNDN